MEMLLDLAMTFWQWTVLGVLVIIGYIVNKFDKEEEDLIQFKYPDMPKMQPIIKNLQNVALRNRNILSIEKSIMPHLRSDSLQSRKPGSTKEPNSPQSPQSPLRKQFYHKYLVDTDVKRPQSKGDNRKVLNMVFANK